MTLAPGFFPSFAFPARSLTFTILSEIFGEGGGGGGGGAHVDMFCCCCFFFVGGGGGLIQPLS